MRNRSTDSRFTGAGLVIAIFSACCFVTGLVLGAAFGVPLP